MAADERIRVFGEDVADAREAVLAEVEGKGGVFGTTHGLQRAFGQARCYNTPLAEANIIGRAVGQAMRGLRPVPEIQFFDYIWPAMTQIKSEAADDPLALERRVHLPDGPAGPDRRLPHRRLDLAQPVRRVDLRPRARAAHRLPVARAATPPACCGPRSAARTRCCSSSTSTCCASPTPATPSRRPDHAGPARAGRGAPARASDLTIVTWGATVQKSVEAAEAVAATTGIEVEVIDLRTIAPWDHELVAESRAPHRPGARRARGRAVPGVRRRDRGLDRREPASTDLDAPVRRVGRPDCHVAYEPTLEAAVLPQVADIDTAARDLLAF